MGSSSRSEASDKLLRKAHKRKRENNESAATTTKKTKKSRRGRDTGVEEEIKSAQAEGGVQASESQTGPTAEEKAVEDDSAHKEEETRGETKGADGSDVGEKDGEDEASLEKKQKKGKGKKSKTSKEGEDVDEQTLKKRRRKEAAESPVANDIDPEMKKHASVFSKFSKSQKINEQLAATKAAKGSEEEGEEEQAEEAEKHGLEPLPQPAPAPESTEKPTYSTLPKWLTEPAVVPLEERRPFTELGVNERLLSVLQHAGYKEAFPIQSAVLQLLQAGKHKHTGDVCISAATGSGKTLAYALPVVSSIEPAPVPRLRGLIVVPTRELVRQARDSCEVCASGSGLRIGTAVGAVSLKEEQAHLMREDKIYDPLAYREQQEKLMSAADWKDFDLQRYLAESQSAVHQTPDYILRPAPNVDILVCTPGRLVDHIKSTKGFTLEHLQWLVIDEADRLLNESFQEWVDVVIPALNTTRFAREGKAAETLAKMGFPLRKQYPLRKIILSATMTRDLEKLNSLRLENPKLVVVGKSAEKDVEMAAAAADVGGPGHVPSTDEFTLPDTLVEKYVPVGDGAEKPLYLLALLLQKINVLGGMDKETARRSSVSSTSSASSSSSSDSGDSDTDSESEDG
ncbi:ATP-dependent RNA helicase ddx51, partial [Ascosphaera atra]